MNRERVAQFKEEQKCLNEIVMKNSTNKIKKFYSLDAHIYKEEILPKKIKELIGLAASLVLRCDDCIFYHLAQCYGHDVTDAELEETTAIALIVGGSITIPHIRKAFAFWDQLKSGTAQGVQKR
ncbi:alkylhydroperoxidase [candidate division WOR_3 bacterium SM23_60]|uniref:Alkylhydroperoxidase n=1 Tax=candidate division WOR_3 bacterium SM23_60 TaxID=1703780 RepID=A0A0S8G6R5_UNCW3|nr:MAG: alkylhydroperoxidase [candidate division WOR_3 bacterium SM23_60]